MRDGKQPVFEKTVQAIKERVISNEIVPKKKPLRFRAIIYFMPSNNFIFLISLAFDYVHHMGFLLVDGGFNGWLSLEII